MTFSGERTSAPSELTITKPPLEDSISTFEFFTSGYLAKTAERVRTRLTQASSSIASGTNGRITLTGSALAKSLIGSVWERLRSAARLRERPSTADLYTASVSSQKNRRTKG